MPRLATDETPKKRKFKKEYITYTLLAIFAIHFLYTSVALDFEMEDKKICMDYKIQLSGVEIDK